MAPATCNANAVSTDDPLADQGLSYSTLTSTFVSIQIAIPFTLYQGHLSMSDSVPEKVELDCVAVSQEGSTSVMEPKWEELRRLSLSPGGFGKRRVELWYAPHNLLHIYYSAQSKDSSTWRGDTHDSDRT